MFNAYWLVAVILPYASPSLTVRTARVGSGSEKMTFVPLVSRRVRRKVSVVHGDGDGDGESDVALSIPLP